MAYYLLFLYVWPSRQDFVRGSGNSSVDFFCVNVPRVEPLGAAYAPDLSNSHGGKSSGAVSQYQRCGTQYATQST